MRKSFTLSEEHVIPRGLLGKLILPKASCKRCAKITGGFEGACLQNTFGVLRARLGIKPRHKKDVRTQHKQTFITNEGVSRTEVMPIDRTPFGVFGILLPLPGMVSGLATHPDRVEARIWMNPLDEKILDELPEGERVIMGEFRLDYFARMLAKIAHAHTVALVGLRGFKPVLPNIILGHDNNWQHFVGGYSETIPADDSKDRLHSLTLNVRELLGGRYFVSDVRLFGNYGAPVYQVVVGECR